jgi:predicted lactoylglutathione lyase
MKEVWFNLPVKDLEKSKAFFTALGFNFSDAHGGPDCLCMLLGEKNVVVMLFEENMFSGFAQHPLTDTSRSCEVMISFDAESPAAVDAMAEKAEKAGANVFGKPQSIQGWMYGFGFADLDGHRWNMLHMDMSKMSAANCHEQFEQNQG